MANPNPEIWGLPETWIYCNLGGGSSSSLYDSLKISRPKTADFGTESNKGRLDSGITSGRITANEPLDLSICPCGQDEKVSAFGKIALYNETGSGGTTPRVIERSSTCNWFMYEQTVTTSTTIERLAIYKDYSYSTYRGMKFSQWSPKATNSSGANVNYRISPYVFWYTRSLLLRIEVKIITSVSSSGLSGSWVSLDSWKNNYNTYNICGLRFIPMAVNNLDTSNMLLQYIDSSLSQYNYSGKIGILDIFPDIRNDGTATDTTFFSFLCTSDRGREGLLFTDTYASSTAMFAILPGYNMFEGQTTLRGGNSSAGYFYYHSIPYSEANYETAMKMISCFGCYFTPTARTEFAYAMTDTDLYLPIIDENGIAHGEYTHGSENVNNDLYDLDSIRGKDYDPSKPPSPVDPNTYSYQTYFNPILNLASMCKRYVLNDAAVEQLCRDLWKISDDLIHTDPNEDFKDYDQLMLDNFLVNSPIDVIVSLDKYPISNIPTGTNAEPIKYGKATGAALGKPLTINTIFFNFEGVRIFPKFGNCFLDYAPYTSYELYIPFCGVVQISAGEVMNKILSIQMVMDMSTGAVTAYIMADNLCIETANGTAALNIPVSGIDAVTLNSQINNALINAKSAQMQARTTGTSMGRIGSGSAWKWLVNPIGVVEQEISDKWKANIADYDLTHIPAQPHMIGSASAACSWSLELSCRLMIYYPEGGAIDSSGGVSTTSPKLKDLSRYGHTTGFACIENSVISNFHGYTVADIIADSIPCTESERNRIKEAFATGVFLP